MNKAIVRMVSLVMILFLAATNVHADPAWNALAVERRVYTYLTEELNLNSAAACGILANIEQESAFRVTNIGDQGTSFGLCQWHNERYTALRGYCMARNLDYKTVEGQMAYLAYELRSDYASLYGALRAVENTPDGAYTAGYLWCVRFERPAQMEKKGVVRGNRAKYKYWNRYNSLSVLSPELDGPDVEEMLEDFRQESPSHMDLPGQGQSGEKTETGRKYVAPKLEKLVYEPYHKRIPGMADMKTGIAHGIAAGILFSPLGDGRKFRFKLPDPEELEPEPETAEKK